MQDDDRGSASTTASSTSCVTKITVTGLSAVMRRTSGMHLRADRRIELENGSSISKIVGSVTRLRPSAARLRIPPDNSCG